MKHNLHSDTELSYPHYTKVTDNEIHIVTTPDKLIEVGDVVYAKGLTARMPKKEIKSISEQRPAKGLHQKEAIFQLCQF